MQTERELQLHRELELMEETRGQYRRIERKLDWLEDDVLWQNRRSKELNDELFECYAQDKKLQQILTSGEELLQRQILAENSFFQECREYLCDMEKKAELQMDEYRQEIQKIQKENAKGEEGNEDNDYGHYAAVRQKF